MTEYKNTISPFLVALDNPIAFRHAINVMRELASESQVTIDSMGFRITQMDPANVSVMELHIKPDHCAEFESSPQRFIINLNDLYAALRMALTTDSITLSESDNKLRLTIDRGIDFSRHYLLTAQPIDGRVQIILTLPFKTSILLPSERFYDAIREADVIGESVTFDTNNETFCVTSQAETLSYHSNLKKSPKGPVAKTKYSIEYVKKMVAAKELSRNVLVEYNTDFPLQLTYKKDGLSLRFVLAPRIDSN